MSSLTDRLELVYKEKSVGQQKTTAQLTSSPTMAPYVECMACGKEFHLENDFEHGDGSTTECPNCSAVLDCVEEEAVRYWKWRVVTYSGPPGGK